jgi:type IV pilus assembly protein PilY1
MFQVSNQEDDSDAAIAEPIGSGGLGSPQRTFPDVIQYLYDADLANGSYGSVPDLDDKQNVISYFIVDETKINTTTRGYARAGGTGVPLALSEDPDELVATLNEIFKQMGVPLALSEDPDELVATLNEIFKQILSVSTTFVAASVPVNVFNRPYWVGNVKKLKIAGANNTSAAGTIVDALGDPAVAADGRIRFDALTSWTDPGSLPAPDLEAGEVEGRDGRTVARGGAGQRIAGFQGDGPQEANGFGGRTIYYDKTSSSLAAFNVDLTIAQELQSDFDVATAAEAEELIAYGRGLDVDDLDNDNDTNDARGWIFGDPLHSRPLPINYGAIGGFSEPNNPGIYVAVASTLR